MMWGVGAWWGGAAAYLPNEQGGRGVPKYLLFFGNKLSGERWGGGETPAGERG